MSRKNKIFTVPWVGVEVGAGDGPKKRLRLQPKRAAPGGSGNPVIYDLKSVLPEPVEPKLFWAAGAETGAVINYFGSGSAVPEPKLSFL